MKQSHTPRAVVLALTVGRQARIARDVAERAGVSLTVFGVKRQLEVGVSARTPRAVSRFACTCTRNTPQCRSSASATPRRARTRRTARSSCNSRCPGPAGGYRNPRGCTSRTREEDDPAVVALVPPHPEYPGKHRHVPSAWHSPMSHGLHGTEQSSPAYPNPPKTFSTLAAARARGRRRWLPRLSRRASTRRCRREVQQRRPDPSLVPDRRATCLGPDTHAGHGIVQSAPTYPSWQMQTPSSSSGYSPLSSFTKSTAQVPLPKPPGARTRDGAVGAHVIVHARAHRVHQQVLLRVRLPRGG